MQASKNDTINKVIEETANKQEAKDVANWLSSTIEGQQHLSDMLDRDAYLMETEPLTHNSLSEVRSDRLFKRIDNKIMDNRLRRVSLRAAAILLPLIIITGFSLFVANERDLWGGITYSEIYVPKGEDARVFFQDGTEVFLNADTRLRYPDRFGLWKKREVYLDGEAYFNVKSNHRKPFIVHAQNTKVEVLGTSFNVNAYSNNSTVKVVLDEGKTHFQVNENSYPMLPGQQIEYDKTTARTTLRNLMHPSRASLWKQNTLYFYDTPLAEVIKVLERRYDVQFHVNAPEALEYSYTITTRQADINGILQELHKIAPVRFKEEGNSIVVSL